MYFLGRAKIWSRTSFKQLDISRDLFRFEWEILSMPPWALNRHLRKVYTVKHGRRILSRQKKTKMNKEREVEREKIEPLNLAPKRRIKYPFFFFEHMQPIDQTIYRVFRGKFHWIELSCDFCFFCLRIFLY